MVESQEHKLNLLLNCPISVATRPLRGVFSDFAIARVAICRYAADVYKSTPAITLKRLGKRARALEIYASLVVRVASKLISEMENYATAGYTVYQRCMITKIRSHELNWIIRHADVVSKITGRNA